LKVLELCGTCALHEAIGHCYDRLENFAQTGFLLQKSNTDTEDGRMHYKNTCTYMNELHGAAQLNVKYALRTQLMRKPDYNLVGQCYMQMNNDEALTCLMWCA
jgi:hypothetical protein